MSYYKIKKMNEDSHWLLNGKIEVKLKSGINIHTWLADNTNCFNGRVDEYSKQFNNVFYAFTENGYTPLLNCYSTKADDGKILIKDNITWFLFDGINEDYSINSIAVNYNTKNDVFTVYKHSISKSPDMRKRIGIFDSIYDVLELTKGYIPIKCWANNEYHFSLDWDKLVNVNIYGKKCLEPFGVHYEMDPDIKGSVRTLNIEAFERRVNRIINDITYRQNDNLKIDETIFGNRNTRTIKFKNGEFIEMALILEYSDEYVNIYYWTYAGDINESLCIKRNKIKDDSNQIKETHNICEELGVVF